MYAFRNIFVVTTTITSLLLGTAFASEVRDSAVSISNEASGAYTVLKNGDVTRVVDDLSGEIVYQDVDSAAAILYAMAEGARVRMLRGIYEIERPIDLVSNFRLDLSPGAELVVPIGYDGYVLGFLGRVENTTISGGLIREDGDEPLRRWDAILLRSASRFEGVFFNSIEGTFIRDAGTAIRLKTEKTDGWINGNSFRGLRIWHPDVFVEFEVASNRTKGMHRNYFENLNGQAGANTIFGVKNIGFRENMFVNVVFWDIYKNRAAVSSNVSATAKGTVILGGNMTQQNFRDEGVDTQIVDSRFNQFSRGAETSFVDSVGKFFRGAPISKEYFQMRSPNGSCFRIRVADDGELVSRLAQCQ